MTGKPEVLKGTALYGLSFIFLQILCYVIWSVNGAEVGNTVLMLFPSLILGFVGSLGGFAYAVASMDEK